MATLKEPSAIIIFGLITICYVANAKPDTTLVSRICNGIKFDRASAIGMSILYVQSDVTVHTSSNGYNYYGKSPWETNVAYGYGNCGGELEVDDCNACMMEAYNEILDGCPLNTGAQVKLFDCMIRYETYGFTD